MKVNIFVAALIGFAFALIGCATKSPSTDDLKPLKTEIVAELRLPRALEAGREPFVVSASGLIRHEDRLYFVADDDDALFAAKADGGQLEVIWRGRSLPAENRLRKKLKPDYESLVFLDSSAWPPAGALVAWPSASGPERQRALVLPRTKGGKWAPARRVSISSLANTLRKTESFLNMEGIFLRDSNVFFVQRGNAPGAHSGLFKMPQREWSLALRTGDWSKAQPAFTKWDLGDWHGVPLALAEAQASGDEILALATGEETDQRLKDGAVAGTILVRLEADGKVRRLGFFPEGLKMEGFALEGDGQSLLTVDDADQVAKPSRLYRVRLN